MQAIALYSLLTSALAADPAPTQLQEVTVTATSSALAEQREAATQKTVIDRAEIESLGALTVGEVIKKLPGIEAGEHDADGGMGARTRGMTRDAVQFLVNGERPTANARFALTQVGRMAANDLERIEILRGGSAEFGGAAAVTVNLIMRKPVARAASMLKLAAGLRGAEANGQFSASHGGGEGDFSWLLPVSVNRHAMPVDQSLSRLSPGGAWQQETQRGDYIMNELILSPRLAWKRDTDSLTLWPSYYHNDGERATQVARSDNSARTDREENSIRILRLRADGTLRVGENKWSGRAAVMQGHRTADRDRRALDTPGVASAWNEAEERTDHEFSAAVRLDRSLGRRQAFFSTGIEFAQHRRDDRQTFTGTIASVSDFAGAERQWTLWLQDEWSLAPKLTLTSGLRGEHMNIETNGASRRHGAVDPSVALRWEVAPSWVARRSLSGAIRFPKLEELTAIATREASANTPLEPDRGGHPALRPERVVNWEAGLERHLADNDGILSANAYLRRTSDFVERRVLQEGVRWVSRPHNEGEARHWGMELSAKLRTDAIPLLKGGSLRTHLTLPQGKVDDTRLGLTRPVRKLPRYNFSLGYEGALPTWQSTWGFQWQQSGAVRSDVPGELAVDTRRRDLLDLHLVRRLDAALNLRFVLQNILGTDSRRVSTAWNGADVWRLNNAEAGQRTWLVSLDGKW